MVARYHGSTAAVRLKKDFLQQFRQKEIPDDIPDYHCAADQPVWICSLLTASGTVSSNGEARRLIQQGGVKLDGEKMTNADLEVRADGRTGFCRPASVVCAGDFSALTAGLPALEKKFGHGVNFCLTDGRRFYTFRLRCPMLSG